MNKIGGITTDLSAGDSLTLRLSDQMFSPCYKSESTNTFSVRHSFSLGDWMHYDASRFAVTNVLANVVPAAQENSFFKDILVVLPNLDRANLKYKIDQLCQSLDNARVWTAFNLKPTSSQIFDPSSWDVSHVSSQVRIFHLAQHHARRKSADYTTDFTIAEFYDRYSSIFPRNMDVRALPPRESVTRFLDGRKLPVGEWFVGNERVWVGELGWENLEGELDDCIAGVRGSEELFGASEAYTPGTPMNETASGYGFYAGGSGIAESREGLMDQVAERYPREIASDDKSYYYGMDGKERMNFNGDMEARNIEVVGTTSIRKLWLVLVWALTWPIPSFVLKYVGRMKRKDVQMAWREKVTICFFIFMLCGTVIFYIIFFQKLICPEFDKVDTSMFC
jgi:chitin synthase